MTSKRPKLAARETRQLAPIGYIGPDGAARLSKHRAEVAQATGLSIGDVEQALRGMLRFGGTGAEWGLLSPEDEALTIANGIVLAHIAKSLAPNAKKRRPGVRVTVTVEGTGKRAEQLVLDLMGALNAAA